MTVELAYRNFNGITLLDGSMNADGASTIMANAQKEAAAIMAAAQAQYNDIISGVQSSQILNGKDIMLEDDEDNDPANVGEKSIYQVLEPEEGSEPGFVVNLENISFTISDTGGTNTIGLVVNGVTITLSEADLANAAQALIEAKDDAMGDLTEDDVAEGLILKGATLAAVIAKAIQDGKGGTGVVDSNGIFTAGSDTFKVSADGTKLVFKATSKLPADFNVDLRIISDVMAADEDEVDATGNTWASEAISISGATSGLDLSDDSTTSATISMQVSWTDAEGGDANTTITIDLSEVFADKWAANSATVGAVGGITLEDILKALPKAISSFHGVVMPAGRPIF